MYDKRLDLEPAFMCTTSLADTSVSLAVRRSQTLGVVDSLLHHNPNDPAWSRHPYMQYDNDGRRAQSRLKGKKSLWVKLLRALWLHARANLSTGRAEDAQKLEMCIYRALELLQVRYEHGSAETMQQEEELLQWTIGAMGASGDAKWRDKEIGIHFIASNGATVSLYQFLGTDCLSGLRKRYIDALCKRGRAVYALTSLALPMAAEAREERNLKAPLLFHVQEGLAAIARSLELNPDERDAYEDAVRTLVELHEMGVQRAQNEKEHDRSSCLLLRWRARLAELLLLRGKTADAEALQRQLVSNCAEHLAALRARVESRCAQSACFGLRWVRLSAEPTDGQLITNEGLSMVLSPEDHGPLSASVRLAGGMGKMNVIRIDRAKFDELGLPFTLAELPQDCYVQAGEAYWRPSVPTTEEILRELEEDGSIEDVDLALHQYQDSIAGAEGREHDYPFRHDTIFTDVQGLHTLLHARGASEEATALVQVLAQLHVEQVSGTWLGVAINTLMAKYPNTLIPKYPNTRAAAFPALDDNLWRKESELLERLCGGGSSVDALRLDMEAQIATKVAACTLELGAKHTRTLHLRGRHACMLYMHGKHDAARAILTELLTDYGSFGVEWRGFRRFSSNECDAAENMRGRDADSVCRGLLELLEKHGFREEHMVLEARVKAAEVERDRRQLPPSAAAVKASFDELLDEIKKINSSDPHVCIPSEALEAAGKRLVACVRQHWRDNAQATLQERPEDSSNPAMLRDSHSERKHISHFSCSEVSMFAYLLGHTFGKHIEAIALYRECIEAIRAIKSAAEEGSYTHIYEHKDTLWQLRLSVAGLQGRHASRLSEGSAEQISELTEARKEIEALVDECEGSSRHDASKQLLHARVELSCVLALEARSLRRSYEAAGEAAVEADAADESNGGTTGGKSTLKDALAHTALEITALRARERLGQAERLVTAIAAQLRGCSDDDLTVNRWETFPSRFRLWSADEAEAQLVSLRRQGRRWDGEEEEEEGEEGEEDFEGEEDEWGEEDETNDGTEEEHEDGTEQQEEEDGDEDEGEAQDVVVEEEVVVEEVAVAAGSPSPVKKRKVEE